MQKSNFLHEFNFTNQTAIVKKAPDENAVIGNTLVPVDDKTVIVNAISEQKYFVYTSFI